MKNKINLLNKKKFPFLKVSLVVFILLFLLTGSIISLGYLYYTSDLPDLRDITGYKPSLVNEIYSSDGKLVGQFGIEKRKLVTIGELSKNTVNAFIAVEDRRFFEHSGIDIKGILRALIQNIRSGGVVSGGSTITQQVTKNLVLSPERTLSRKIKEAILAYRIEKNLTKEEILYLYLNHIYLADGTYGVEAASYNYFGKSAKQLNIAEAALLAGIPKRPEYYSPRKNLKRSLERQKRILKMMYENKFISESDYKNAVNTKIEIIPKRDINYRVAPYFVEFVRQYLEKKVGERAYKLGGYRVVTTIDIDISLAANLAIRRGILNYESRWGNHFIQQKLRSDDKITSYLQSQELDSLVEGELYNAMVKSVKPLTENIFKADINLASQSSSFKYAVSKDFATSDKNLLLSGNDNVHIVPSKLEKGDVIKVKILNFDDNGLDVEPFLEHSVQAALLSIDSNGNILAMVGGYDFSESQFNRSTQAFRQPGSSFKPLVYSSAIDKGYTQTSILFDMPVEIKGWEPKNYDGQYKGAMVLRKALAKSRNLATVRMLMDVGPSYVAQYANRFKFKSKFNPYPSLALGGSDVTLMEMVSAYSVYPNGGVWVEPRFILRIYDRNDQIIEDNTGEYFLKNEKVLKKEREQKRQEILKALFKKKDIPLEKNSDIDDSEFLIEKDFKPSRPLIENADSNFLTAEEFVELIRSNPINFEPARKPERLINIDTAYIMSDLMRAVISEGTGVSAQHLTKFAPIAGKTGTTNDYTDAWFVGFSPKVTTGVWVGKDNHSPLGKRESGAKAALPIWIDYMKDTLSKSSYKGGSFRKPAGVKIVETPYGRIPYSLSSLRDNILESLRAEIDNSPGITESSSNKSGNSVPVTRPNRVNENISDEAEIDFLLRR